MVKLIPAEKLAPQWHDVTISDGQQIRLKVRRPTPAEVMNRLGAQADESMADYTLRRINMLIVDWDGILDESTGQPVPYSFDSLVQLLTQIPSAIWAVSNLISNVMHGLSETDQKNFPMPPANGGMTTPAAAKNGSGSFDYQTPVSDANQSVTVTV